MRKLLLFIGLTLALTACRQDIVYSRFVSIPSGEWHVDSIAAFDYPVADKQADYRIVVYVRHTERYPYQNMWLFIDNGQRADTIEFYLADDRGRWLGDGHHGFIEMPVLLEQNYHFKDTGTHHMTIQQGMRDSVLRGVIDVGVEVVKNGKE